jgi:hypothetical protein
MVIACGLGIAQALMARLMPILKPHTLDAHTALNDRCNAVPLIEKA